MQPQEDPTRVLQGLHGNSTQGFLLKNLYCLEYLGKKDAYQNCPGIIPKIERVSTIKCLYHTFMS